MALAVRKNYSWQRDYLCKKRLQERVLLLTGKALDVNIFQSY